MPKLDDLAADDTEPKKTKADKKPRKRASGGPTIPQIREGLEGLTAMVGTGWVLAGNEYCGTAVLERGPAVTDSLLELAKTNPRVKRSLQNLTRSSAWGGVIIAASSLAVPILAYYGVIPPHYASLVGAAPPIVDVETGGARHTDRPDGTRQNNTRTSHTATAEPHASTSL